MEIVVTYENPNSEDSLQDNIVAEPVAEYRPTEKPPYAGTSINKAIKDYYACPTNKEKVSVLQWIVENPEFQVLKRYSTAENAVYGLNISQYDDILLSGEMPKNLVIAQKLVANKFDVFLLSNPTSTKSADFVLPIFGDYMALPPIEERGQHHSGVIFDVEKPYTDYVNKLM